MLYLSDVNGLFKIKSVDVLKQIEIERGEERKRGRDIERVREKEIILAGYCFYTNFFTYNTEHIPRSTVRKYERKKIERKRKT